MATEPLSRPDPLYRQVYKSLRRDIESGTLPPGARIATSPKLAAQFGAGVCTVQAAMSALEREGLIERRQRLGTFVKGWAPRLSKVGIYFDDDFWRLGGMDYYRLLCGELQLLLDSEGVSHRLFMDRQTGSVRPHFPKDLRRAARSREIQAVIAPLISNINPSAVEELGIPLVKCGRTGDGNVSFDFSGMLSLALGYLAAQACRSAGFLALVSKEDDEFLAKFVEAAKEAGLAPDVRFRAVPDETLDSGKLELFGYRHFTGLLESGPLPDGLLVFPDILARGVIMGILEKGIKVPERLKLVLHENEGNPIFRPFPAATVLTSPAVVARAMLRQARLLVAGESAEIVSIPYRLMKPGDSGPCCGATMDEES